MLGRPTPKHRGIRLIVGLGNPPEQYGQTRHNAGARFVERLAKHYHIKFKTEGRLNARLAQWSLKGAEYRLLLPNTYMNHSGQSVGAAAQYFKILPQSILVVHDELDLAPGNLQFKFAGGHAGHNGLRDIFHHLQTAEFHRLRLGIGHPGHKDEVADYVLKKASQEQSILLEEAEQRAIHELPEFLHRIESEC